MGNSHLPGRLGDPAATFETDYRSDRRIVEAMKAAGMFAAGGSSIASDAPYEACLQYCSQVEAQQAEAHPLFREMIPDFPDVEVRTEVIKGVDGNDIKLYLHLPKDAAPGPGLVHTHGGGMVIMTAADPGFVLWRNHLANEGLRCIGVEFRNGGGELGSHPFPAGLNDCASAVQWVAENRAALGITTLTISGESGGGNLAIATTLKAKQEGWLNQINGVYACCPYIFGDYLNPAPELQSLIENDGYMLNRSDMSAMVTVYNPDRKDMRNPLAWPFHATTEDLKGLPPHVISVNELDPLRDEGLEFYRKLLAAGVSATARTVHGTPHAGDLSMPHVAPDLFSETLGSVKRFAGSLG